jgi:hypothetical protein
MPDEEKKVTPPEHKVFTVCPVCGSDRRDGDMEKSYRRELGTLPPEETMPVIIMLQVPLPVPNTAISPLTGMAKVPTLYYHFDRCADCGTLYTPQFEVKEQQVPINMTTLTRPSGPPPPRRRLN